MTMFKFLKARLDLFDGGSGAAGGDGGASGATSDAAGQNSGDLSKVVYGKQPEETNADAADQVKESAEDRTRKYKEFINEYKDIHTQENQKIFDRRFKDYKDLQKTVGDQGAILDRLMQRWNVSDLESLSKAIDDDDEFWSDKAHEAGLSIEQYKEFSKLRMENERLAQAEAQRIQQAQADQQVAIWQQEAEALKNKFPNFSIEAEVNDPQFQRLIQNGIPMETAYLVCHHNEIQNGVARAVAADTEKKVADSIRAKGSRPMENGTTSSSAFGVKNDVTKLTKADRAEVARRAKRGQEISF